MTHDANATDLSCPQGNSRTYELTIRDANAVVVDLTNAVVRWAYGTPGNVSRTLRSYDANEISFPDAVNGRADVKLRSWMSAAETVGELQHQTEVILQGDTVTLTGTPTLGFTAGSGIVDVTGATMSELKAGMMIVPTGTGAPNQVRHIIQSVDELNNQYTTDYNGFTLEAGVAFSIYHGDTDTPDNLYGCFTISPRLIGS